MSDPNNPSVMGPPPVQPAGVVPNHGVGVPALQEWEGHARQVYEQAQPLIDALYGRLRRLETANGPIIEQALKGAQAGQRIGGGGLTKEQAEHLHLVVSELRAAFEKPIKKADGKSLVDLLSQRPA